MPCRAVSATLLTFCLTLAAPLLPPHAHAAEPAKKVANEAPPSTGRGVPPSNATELQPPEAPPRPVATRRAVMAGITMVSIAGGCFQMGDTHGGGFSDEKPLHEVCVSDFAIGTYEVTQGEWRRVMGKNPSHFSSCGDDCPVENVSWDDVQKFIKKLNRSTGGSFRLPTEAEWEYAARSGGREEKYSGGDDADAVAWYEGNSGGTPHPVGQKQANGLGIHDMSGNVWEWVSDWYGGYGTERQQAPAGPATGSFRVYRGGGWSLDLWSIRTTNRAYSVPGKRVINLGFRLASPPLQ